MNEKKAKRLRRWVRALNAPDEPMERDRFGTMRYPNGSAQRHYRDLKV